MPTYSRRDEREADRLGLMYMAKAGYNPEAALSSWRRAARASDRSQSLTFLSTHPSDRQRVELLQKHLPKAKALYKSSKVEAENGASSAHSASYHRSDYEHPEHDVNREGSTPAR